MSVNDDMMNKLFNMVKEKIEADKPKPKQKRKRNYTKAQRKVMLANLAAGRKKKIEMLKERRKAKASKSKAKPSAKAEAPPTQEVVEEVKEAEPPAVKIEVKKIPKVKKPPVDTPKPVKVEAKPKSVEPVRVIPLPEVYNINFLQGGSLW